MIRGFSKRRIFTEFTLMCVASLGAFAIGEYADGAAVMYLYSLGETLSDGAYSRSKRNISELLEITPEYASVMRGTKVERVSPEDVAIGETVLVVSGERIPLDGTVCEGGGSADTSSVTGESKPLELYCGVWCPSGAILSEGSVRITVESSYENSVVARLTKAVEQASARKASAEKKISRFARVFTPIAFAIAVLIALIGALITKDAETWISTGLAVLVVSCPCSLVLSVPLTYFAGIGSAAARGIIFRGGEIIDAVRQTRAVLFDKTGTLTEAGLSFDGAELYSDIGEKEFLSVAYDVLTHSPHAAAISFCAAYKGDIRHSVTDAQNIGGRGIVCNIDGRRAAFGNAALMRELGIELEDSPTTAIFGALDGHLIGKLNFSSHLKAGAICAVKELGELGVARVAVLSGDGSESVAESCAKAGIDEYYFSLTPDRKADVFDRIRAEERAKHKNGAVAYCGDGLNDSAVIAGADIGIAMGQSGSALTVSSADIVLMDDDPLKLCEAIRIARRTSRIATQNIVLSLGIKIVVLVAGIVMSWTTGNAIPMGLAIIADVGAAILAVLNALRASKKGAKKHEKG